MTLGSQAHLVMLYEKVFEVKPLKKILNETEILLTKPAR
jgi:hypothetical protein